MKSVCTGVIPITVVIPVKNQVDALRSCLEAVQDVARILVVDSGSTDGTIEAAQHFGAEVLQFRWGGGFPKKRNWVLQTYSFPTEWVLFLDADEIITSKFRQELRHAIQSNNHAGYWIKFANYFQGRLLRFGLQQRKLALFRVGAGFYEKIDDPGWSDLDMEIHEHPVLNGPVGTLNQRIRHEDHSSLYKFIERHNKYSTWEAQRYLAQFSDSKVTGTHLTFRQRVKYALIPSPWLSLLYFFYTYLLLGGLLDGAAGLYYAIYKAQYFFDISRKVAEIRAQKSNGDRQLAPERYTPQNGQKQESANRFEL
jgi:Glycosyltransferases involved in cell wall biogenesis